MVTRWIVCFSFALVLALIFLATLAPTPAPAAASETPWPSAEPSLAGQTTPALPTVTIEYKGHAICDVEGATFDLDLDADPDTDGLQPWTKDVTVTVLISSSFESTTESEKPNNIKEVTFTAGSTRQTLFVSSRSPMYKFSNIPVLPKKDWPRYAKLDEFGHEVGDPKPAHIDHYVLIADRRSSEDPPQSDYAHYHAKDHLKYVGAASLAKRKNGRINANIKAGTKGPGDTYRVVDKFFAYVEVQHRERCTVTHGVELSDKALTVGEAGRTKKYTAKLRTRPESTVTVSVATGSPLAAKVHATGGTPGDAAELTFTRDNWNRPQSVTVTGVDDNIDNPNGARYSLISHTAASSDTDYNKIFVPDVTVTVSDDDSAPTVSLILTPSTIAEGGASNVSTVTASLSGATTSSEDITLTVAAAAVAPATAGDFNLSSNNTLTIAAGATTSTGKVTITAVDNNAHAPSKTITVSATPSTPTAALTPDAPANVTLTITDDDAAPSGITLTANPDRVREDASDTTVTVTASTGSTAYAEDKTVTVTVGGGTATEGVDYANVADFTITIPSGQTSGTGQFSLSPSDDVIHEQNETISVSGSVTTGSSVTVAPDTITIEDNDVAPSGITLDVNSERSITVSEGAGATEVIVTASTGDAAYATTKTVNVTVGKSGDGAIEGTDYTTVDDFTITILAGQNSGSHTFTFTPTDDTIDEVDEDVTVSGVVNGEPDLAVDSATITITDNDAEPTVSLTLSPSSISESGQTNASTVTATLAGGTSSEDITLTVSAAPVSPAQASDFNLSNNKTLTIVAGQTASKGTVTITAKDNKVDAPDKTVTISATPSTATASLTPDAPAHQTLTITDDDDAPTVSLTLTPSTIAESGATNSSTVTASLKGGTSSEDITLTVSAAPVSPAVAGDYDLSDNTILTIAAGETASTGEVTITAVDNNVDAPNKTVTVSATVTTTTLDRKPADPDNETLTITNDDKAGKTVTLSVDPKSVEEGDGTPMVTVTATLTDGVTFPKAKTVKVTVGKQDSDSAVSGTDYAEVDGFDITIPAGASSKKLTFTLTPTDDALDEDAEILTVHGTSPGLTVNGAKVTITDNDDEPTVKVDDATAVNEGDNPGTTVDMSFTVTLSAVSGRVVTVPYTIESGSTATAGSDYVNPATKSITIAAGSTTGKIVIKVKGDRVNEDDESIAIKLGAPTNATLSTVDGETDASGTIKDDDDRGVTITESGGDTAVTEPSGSDTYTVVLTSRPTAPVTVDLAVAPASGVVTVDKSTLTFQPGQWDTAQTVTVTAVNDDKDNPEDRRTATIRHAVSGGDYGSVTAGSVSVTVTDDDDAPTVSVGDAGAVTEGDSSTKEMSFPVKLSAVSGNPVTVHYTLSGTATAVIDYDDPAPKSITIPAGGQDGSIVISIRGDTIIEENETIEVKLTDPDHATLSQSSGATTATGTITNDDTAGDISLKVSPTSVAESASATEITVTATLGGGSTFQTTTTVTIKVGGGGGLATSGTDYAAVSEFSITIDAGTTTGTGTFSLDPEDDALDEPDETITISGTADGLSVSSTVVTIIDNDNPPTVSVGDAADVKEGDDPSVPTNMSFPLTLSATSSKAVTVTYTLSGSASAGSDYTVPSPKSVTIAVGANGGSIVIPVKGDNRSEGNETIIVTLTGATNANLSSDQAGKTGTGIITDDDTHVTPAEPSSRTEDLVNTGPAFSVASMVRTVDENLPSTNIGSPITVYNRDGQPVRYSLRGSDAGIFSIDSRSGQLRTRGALNYEERSAYTVTVVATKNPGQSASISVRIEVRNQDEDGTLRISSIHPHEGSRINANLSDPDGGISLVRWEWARSSGRNGTYVVIPGARSDHYTPQKEDVGYYLRVTANYTDRLGPNKRVEVRSASPTSPIGSNNPPEFRARKLDYQVKENALAGENVGGPAIAFDPESDELRYYLSGADSASFDIDAVTGQVRTKAVLDYETKATYFMIVSAADGKDAVGRPDRNLDVHIPLTVLVTDVAEPPAKVIALSVEGITVDSIRVSWSKPDNTGPPIGGYDVDYRRVGGETAFSTEFAVGYARDLTIGGLEPQTHYEVRVRAQNPEGIGEWSELGSGWTLAPAEGVGDGNAKPASPVVQANQPPAFTVGDSIQLSVKEGTAAGIDVNPILGATDPDGDVLFYWISGDFVRLFSMEESTGQLYTGAELGFDLQPMYTGVAHVSDRRGGSDSVELTVLVEDVPTNEAEVPGVVAAVDAGSNDQQTLPTPIPPPYSLIVYPTRTPEPAEMPSVQSETPAGPMVDSPFAGAEPLGTTMTAESGGWWTSLAVWIVLLLLLAALLTSILVWWVRRQRRQQQVVLPPPSIGSIRKLRHPPVWVR